MSEANQKEQLVKQYQRRERWAWAHLIFMLIVACVWLYVCWVAVSELMIKGESPHWPSEAFGIILGAGGLAWMRTIDRWFQRKSSA